jgi:hypothetical protein
MEDFLRDYVLEHFPRLTPQKQRKALELLSPEQRRELFQSLPMEERLAGLSEEQVRQFLDRLTADRAAGSRKPRRKR